jgi:hypothetical protein
VPGVSYPGQTASEATKPSMISMARATGRQKSRPREPVLNPEASGQLRDKLVSEIEHLDVVEAAIEWATRSIEDKNSLSASDASLVEAVFEGRMRVLQPEVYSTNPTPSDTSQISSKNVVPGCESESADKSSATENNARPTKSQASRISAVNGLSSLKPRRRRDKDHLRFISVQPCTVCGRRPCEAHHLRFAQPRALGRRVSDEFTVPLCRFHHRELHRVGDERSWWKRVEIDPAPIALGFWQHTRGTITMESPEPKTPEQSVKVSI